MTVRLENRTLKTVVLAENEGRRKGVRGACPEGCVDKTALANGEAEKTRVVTGAQCGQR